MYIYIYNKSQAITIFIMYVEISDGNKQQIY